MKKPKLEEVQFKKIVYGGQTIAKLGGGKTLFAWGGLPKEKAIVKVTKSKKNWAEGIVEEVLVSSDQRIEPKDEESYLSTSPWQIMNYEYENKLKKELTEEQFKQHGIDLAADNYTALPEPYFYRNKMEFSFWWSNQTNQLDLAFFKRGSHYKQPVEGSSLAKPKINQAALKIRDYLRQNEIQARDLKSLLIRCNQAGSVAAELYVKDTAFQLKPTHEELEVDGFTVHYSDPKSPASKITKTLWQSGVNILNDTILDKNYTYSVSGFFQVNLPMYQEALKVIKKYLSAKKPIVDLYSGVGSIGLSIAEKGQCLTLVELDQNCVKEAENNAKNIKAETEIIHASSENALDYIDANSTIILDPPRAGLHQKIVDKLIEAKPETINYLSCNPATQARDTALLQNSYKIKYAHVFNFFPRTPHIENLVVLSSKV